MKVIVIGDAPLRGTAPRTLETMNIFTLTMVMMKMAIMLIVNHCDGDQTGKRDPKVWLNYSDDELIVMNH